MTATVLETADPEDFDNDGVTNERRLKSGNRYVIRGMHDVQTELYVKGSLDTAYSAMGKSAAGGNTHYKLILTNTTGKDLESMTLIDVLPSVGDLGITDHVPRGSQFALKMKGPIVVPPAWNGKVNLYYSTEANPARDELTRNTIYPDTAVPLTSPAGAATPVWLAAEHVGDWSQIKSFKIEFAGGNTLLSGQSIELEWTMEAPGPNEADHSLFDSSVPVNARAAWNSFAVATDHGQPVEPNAVGVYLVYGLPPDSSGGTPTDSTPTPDPSSQPVTTPDPDVQPTPTSDATPEMTPGSPEPASSPDAESVPNPGSDPEADTGSDRIRNKPRCRRKRKEMGRLRLRDRIMRPIKRRPCCRRRVKAAMRFIISLEQP